MQAQRTSPGQDLSCIRDDKTRQVALMSRTPETLSLRVKNGVSRCTTECAHQPDQVVRIDPHNI